MRWPSVYLFAWLWGTYAPPLFFLGFIAPSFLLANAAPEPWRPGALLAVMLAFLSLGWAALRFPGCPRCERSPYRRGQGLLTRMGMLPPALCDRCGLDLRQFHQGDPRAKRTNPAGAATDGPRGHDTSRLYTHVRQAGFAVGANIHAMVCFALFCVDIVGVIVSLRLGSDEGVRWAWLARAVFNGALLLVSSTLYAGGRAIFAWLLLMIAVAAYYVPAIIFAPI